MLNQLRNIDTAFQHIKRFSYLLLFVNLFTVCFCIWRSYEAVDKAQNKVLLLYNGKVLDAAVSDKRHSLPIELRDHIKVFHEDFFNLMPDDQQIAQTIGNALYLADSRAKKVYNDLRADGYFNSLVSGNISQQVHVDSMHLDLEQYPYPFTCYATETLKRGNSTVTRKLVTQGKVMKLDQATERNPHALLILDWQVLDNGNLKLPDQ
jgi:conjugative transposon TraK protein